MPFLAFSWWYFSLTIVKIQTTFNSIYVCYQFFSKDFHSFTQKWNVKSSEMLIQYSWRKNINLVQVSSVLVLKCSLSFIWRKLRQFSCDHWCPIFAIFAAALGWCRERMQGLQGQHLSGGLCPLLILTTSKSVTRLEASCSIPGSIHWPTGETGGLATCTAHKWSINWEYYRVPLAWFTARNMFYH